MHEEPINKFDIVYQLRRVDQPYPTDTMLKAADEIERLRALTAPQAETCECGQSHPAQPCPFKRTRWTRKDGSTTPRGDVVDRRKSLNGDPNVMRRANMHLGRRKDDLARWAAPVQETPQTWVEWFDANNVDMTLRKLCAELDRRSASK